MNDTWIKLYRKTLSNEGLFRSKNTFPVLCWLLLIADYKTGEAIIGRNFASKWLKIKPSTFYQTLKRLENMNIIQQQSNNKMTTVTIVNWSIYQSKPDRDKTEYKQNVSEMQQESNTIQEHKNKEDKNNIYKAFSYLRNIPEADINDFKEKYTVTSTEIKMLAEQLALWCEASGKAKKNYKSFLQNRLLAKYGFRNRVATFVPDMEPYTPVSQETLNKFKKDREKILGKVVMPN